MRQIKFRAWNFETRKMETPVSIPNYIPEDGSHYEYLQFTGLHDRNGKEIYDGDIVLIKSAIKMRDGSVMENELWIVQYVENAGKFVFTKGTDENALTCGLPRTREGRKRSISRIEIVGDIYRNKELLV